MITGGSMELQLGKKRIDKADERVIRLSDQIQVKRVLYTKDGEEVAISTESYAISEIERKLKELQTQLDNWNNPKWVDSSRQAIIDQIDKLKNLL